MDGLNNFCLVFFLQFFSCIVVQSTLAQSIRIDGTTPTTPEICTGNCTISGGIQNGNNLFHSFSQFNVETGSTVLFSDPGVINILSRVTGTSQSNILGTLGSSSGKANLFLLNPNGILFGPNSSLNVSGSFVATTANAIQFGSQGFFSSSTPKIESLTVNPSALLFTNRAKKIAVKSTAIAGKDLSNQPVFGLKVPDKKSLLLAGGNLAIEGGGLNAFGGQLELGGLANSGLININVDGNKIHLEFPQKASLSNVSITQGSRLNVSAVGGGNIIINAINLDISDNSVLRAGIAQEKGSSNSLAGDIVLNVTGTTKLSNSTIINAIRNGGIGQGGDIQINTGDLILQDKSEIFASTFGVGDAGNISFKVDNKISLDSNSLVLSNINDLAVGNAGKINIAANEISLIDFSQIASFAFGLGKPSDINIIASNTIFLKSDSRIGSSIVAKDFDLLRSTNDPIILGAINNPIVLDSIESPNKVTVSATSLFLTDGGQIATFAAGVGSGTGGDIVVMTTDSVNISGFSQGTEFSQLEGIPNGTGFSSGLFSFARESTTGPAGDIKVKTDEFRISDGGAVSTQTFNKSKSGDISITANNFMGFRGGQIRTTASSEGNAGDITLKVRDNITLSGSDPNFEERLKTLPSALSFIEGVPPEQASREVSIVSEIGPKSGLFANTTRDSSGSGGSIIIDPRLVLIENGANIAVNSAGKGQAGNIALRSDDLTLDRGTITARSNSDAGGNISLSIADILLLRDDSQISTTASGQGTGGKININADFIITAPTENNDITADALNGPGGQITINTKGIVGLKVRKRNTNFSDITAISQNNPQLNGTVNINTPETDPSDN